MKRALDITKLPENEIRCVDEIYVEDDKLAFAWETWFDVDKYFGITEDYDGWINFYTDFIVETGRIKAVYSLVTPEYTKEVEWELTEEEEEFLKKKMLDYTGSSCSSLEDYYNLCMAYS